MTKDFQQNPGIDFSKTYSPIFKASTIRLILTLAIQFKWKVKQLDVNNAFLNGCWEKLFS